MSDLELRREMIELTRSGPVMSWAERLAVIALDAGLQLEGISWGSSPTGVAFQIVNEAKSSGRLPLLVDVVTKRKAAQP